jgi:transposase
VLGSALGKSSFELAEVLGLSSPTIQRWLDRYEAEGLQGLEDRPRSGRPRTVTPDVEAEVFEKTLKEDPPQGTHWATRLMAEETDLHHSQVARIWRAHGLKPYRAKTFKLSKDPRFSE